MKYKVYFSDVGIPASGLSPTWYSFTNINGENITPQPTISGVGMWYVYDYVPSGYSMGVIFGSGLSDSDAYIPVEHSINDFNLDAAISTRPTIDTIIASGNSANWSGIADVSNLATTSNITTAKNEIIASGNIYWTTASGFAVPGDSMNLTASGIDTIIASGNSANWGYVPSGILTISDMYNVLGLNSSGLIDEISTLPLNPSIANAIYLSYMQRAYKQTTNKTTGKVETHNASGNKVFEADVSDDGEIFTKGKLS
jgi:hypothetical protein